jgi:hypothetical protein
VPAKGLPDLIIGRRASQSDGVSDRLPSSMQSRFDAQAPWGILLVPVLGIAGGGGQVLSAHVGGAVLVGGDRATIGPRAEAQLGMVGAGGAVGLVMLPLRMTIPMFGFELNYRYLRPWQASDDHRAESGPELGFDLVSLRVTVTALSHRFSTPLDDRRYVVSVGYGYL